jgi:hypothetical protein
LFRSERAGGHSAFDGKIRKRKITVFKTFFPVRVRSKQKPNLTALLHREDAALADGDPASQTFSR